MRHSMRVCVRVGVCLCAYIYIDMHYVYAYLRVVVPCGIVDRPPPTVNRPVVGVRPRREDLQERDTDVTAAPAHRSRSRPRFR